MEVGEEVGKDEFFFFWPGMDTLFMAFLMFRGHCSSIWLGSVV